MAKVVSSKSKVSGKLNELFLDDLNQDSTGPIVVMVCRKWDVNSVSGSYISTDYVVSDKKGNFIHCVAKKKIAHVFVDRLQEGCLYVIRGFGVEKKSEYMLIEDKPYYINLHGDTVVTRANDNINGFVRHPYKLTSFENLKPTNNKFFVDVVGYVTSVDEPSVKSNGGRTVEFSLCNERKRQVRVTLWGNLGDELIKKKNEGPAVYVLILTAMSAKTYMNNLCLSSSSSTLLVDSDEIPAVKDFKSCIRNICIADYAEPITEDTPVVTTFHELLDQSRDGMGKKHVVMFENTVEILGVRTRNSWYLFACTGGKCRKGLERISGHFVCKGCKTRVDYPRTRYRLELDVTDGIMSAVVVLFDETAEKLLKRTAKSLVEEQIANTSPDAPVLPPVIEALIGTKHVFQIKSYSYYRFGEYESFNCGKVVDPPSETIETSIDVIKMKGAETNEQDVSENVDEIHTIKTSESKTIKDIATSSATTSKSLKRSASNLNTKKKNARKPRQVVDDDSETDGIANDNTLDSGCTNSSRKRMTVFSEVDDDNAEINE